MSAPTRWLQRLFGTAPLDESRWVVLDVESSGLDPQRDRLLAIAAIAVAVDWPNARLGVMLGDSFDVVLRQHEVSSKSNILLHGIGAQQQREGLATDQALRALADFVGASPLLAFHAAFDQALIRRYARLHLGAPLVNPWLDLDQLCAVTHENLRARALDDWLQHFGIHCPQRHQASADALAECELLLRIWPKLAHQCSNWREVQRLARHHRWLPRLG